MRRRWALRLGRHGDNLFFSVHARPALQHLLRYERRSKARRFRCRRHERSGPLSTCESCSQPRIVGPRPARSSSAHKLAWDSGSFLASTLEEPLRRAALPFRQPGFRFRNIRQQLDPDVWLRRWLSVPSMLEPGLMVPNDLANLRLARPVPKARQGLGVPQSQGARLPQARFHPPHDPKIMQFKMMFPDRL